MTEQDEVRMMAGIAEFKRDECRKPVQSVIQTKPQESPVDAPEQSPAPLPRKTRSRLTVAILDAVATAYGIKPHEMMAATKSHPVMLARQVATCLLWEMVGIGYAELGRFFSQDHTTAMSSVRKIRGAKDPKQRAVYEQVREQLAERSLAA